MGSQTKRTKKSKKRSTFDSHTFLATIGLARSVTECLPNYRIFSQGDASNEVFYIQKGSVKLAVLSKQGKAAVVAILSTGDFFGEACLAGQMVRVASATAIVSTSLLKIKKVEMLRVLRKERTLSGLFISYLLTRNMRVEEDLVDQLFNSAEKRLARTLLLLARHGKESKPNTVVLQIDQGTLAEMIGVTRERVNFFMNKFRKLGFIHYNGELEVHSSLLNTVLK